MFHSEEFRFELFWNRKNLPFIWLIQKEDLVARVFNIWKVIQNNIWSNSIQVTMFWTIFELDDKWESKNLTERLQIKCV